MDQPPDPMIDKAAAEAFSAEHAFKRNRYGHTLAAVVTFGPSSSPTRGKPRCACKVWGNIDFGQCVAVGKVALADGSTWCGNHSPEGLGKRAERTRQRRAAERAKHAEARRRALYRNPHIQALLRIAQGDNDPRTTAREALGALWGELTATPGESA